MALMARAREVSGGPAGAVREAWAMAVGQAWDMATEQPAHWNMGMSLSASPKTTASAGEIFRWVASCCRPVALVIPAGMNSRVREWVWTRSNAGLMGGAAMTALICVGWPAHRTLKTG